MLPGPMPAGDVVSCESLRDIGANICCGFAIKMRCEMNVLMDVTFNANVRDVTTSGNW